MSSHTSSSWFGHWHRLRQEQLICSTATGNQTDTSHPVRIVSPQNTGRRHICPPASIHGLLFARFSFDSRRAASRARAHISSLPHPPSMSDENCDPSSKPPLPSKPRPKPVDARSAAASSALSLDSPKSATITNVSQRLPSTSVEVSVGEILSTGDKRASVSIREQQQQQRHSSSSCSSSELDDADENAFVSVGANKMDLGEATRELTRLLHIGNENLDKEIHLNPNAPDFTPIDFSPTYRSELAPAHLHRRATQVDYYNNRYSRSRYYSESYQQSVATSTSTIRPLLSLVPPYVSYHRQSWTTTTPPSASNSWWQQSQHDYSNPSSSSSSYHSRPAYPPLYSPLMAPLTDDSLYPNRHSSKRQRIHSSRAFVFPSQGPSNRKRSHSGPDVPLQPPDTHLSGIHSLTRIMIDLLRLIDPLPVADEHKQPRKYQRRLEQSTESTEAEDVVFVDDVLPTVTGSLATKTTGRLGSSQLSPLSGVNDDQRST